jgi:hypothetical protein
MDYKIRIFIDDGRIFEQYADSHDKAVEEISRIVQDGYVFNDGRKYEHYPSHRIKKVTTDNILSEHITTSKAI